MQSPTTELLPDSLPQRKTAFAPRDAALDPLLLAAVAASGPKLTRNHYHHDFFPSGILPQSKTSWDLTMFTSDDGEPKNLTYMSRQAPRRVRLAGGKQNNPSEYTQIMKTLKEGDDAPHESKKRRLSPQPEPLADAFCSPDSVKSSEPVKPNVQVKCMARTRIPTPHGPAFLHLYHNTHDSKEHLAIVIDPAQFSEASTPTLVSPIRSQTLDAVWSKTETEMDRITRGAYVGRLSPTSQRASDPTSLPHRILTASIPAPLVRVHSECFTGETVGSMRCDCGEQLDEAIRRISQPITIPGNLPDDSPITIPGRGAVVYLRQEGRGIGLLSKIRAYNLQDLGHDTVTANLMLGHQADERGYEIAGAILRDLGLGGDSDGESVRVLTNNPDKVDALQKEGIRVVEQVSMIPRSWQCKQMQSPVGTPVGEAAQENIPGATMIGGKAVYGDDLDKYLRTKITRMGHMLPLWMDEHKAS